MVDEKKMSDDEYQFPQEEYAASDENPEVASTAVEEEVKPSADGFGQKIVEGFRSSNARGYKRLLLVVVAIVVLFLITRAAHFFSENKKTVQAPVQKPVVQQTELPPPAQAPVVSQQPMMGPNPMDSDYRSQTDSKIEALQQQLSTIQDSLNASQNTDQTLQNSMTQLASQVQTLSTQLKQMMARQKAQPHQKQVVFYLRAVVPDRAWVMTSSGETVSVTVGDSLDQYGTIESIDPVYGVIQTSSGRKITYGANDY